MNLKKSLFSQSAMIFALRIGGAGAVFIAQALMARVWGAALLGEYLLVVAVTNLMAMSMPLGFHTVGTYFAADYAARGQGANLRKFLLRAYGHVIFIGLPLALLGYFIIRQVSGPVGQLAAYWPALVTLALGTAIIYINGAILVGLKRPLAGFFADTIFRPVLVLAAFFVVLLTAGSNPLPQFLWIVSIGYLVVALVHFAFMLRSILRVSTHEAADDGLARRWWHFALPWVLVSLGSDFFFDVDLLILSSMLDHEQIAVFGICTRIFVLASFGVSAVYAVAVPGLMEEEARQDKAGLDTRIGEANLVAALFAVILIAGVAVTGSFVLSFFGPGFEMGLVPLLLLCVSLLVRASFGPASVMLSARNHPWASLPALGAGLVVLVAGNLLFVPVWGLTGAASAALLSFATGGFVLWRTALHLTHIDVSIGPGIRQLAGRIAARA